MSKGTDTKIGTSVLAVFVMCGVFLQSNKLIHAQTVSNLKVNQGLESDFPFWRTSGSYRYYFAEDFFPRSILIETEVTATRPLRIVPKHIEVFGCDGKKINLRASYFVNVQGVYYGAGSASGPNEDACNTNALKFSFFQLVTNSSGTVFLRRYEIRSNRHGVLPISTTSGPLPQLRPMVTKESSEVVR